MISAGCRGSLVDTRFNAQVLVTFGTHALAGPPPADPYGARYKGIWVCLLMLSRALGGTYVNFGVFELYGDPALRVRPRHTGSLRRGPRIGRGF